MAKIQENGFDGKLPLGAWVKAGCIAGFAGGLAEVLVMGIYCGVSALSGITILSLITATFAPASFAFGALGAFDGLVIHLALSVAIGAGFAIFQYLSHKDRVVVSYPFVVVTGALTLAGIWAFNFLILLPRINPAFAAYVPLAPSFVSKLSFGISLGLLPRILAGSALRELVKPLAMAERGN
ncbi:MAG: hypothetical protein HZB85_06445 [Deltaproteobacteria bacterium]|nr:hypothetical protein [Deltaproteobacteria bacterium]